MSATTETRTFRADNLEEALEAVRKQLGPEAIVVRQREGIVGGIGGFFGKRCVEIDVECPPADDRAVKPNVNVLPPRAVSNAYAAVNSIQPELEDEDEDDDPGDLIRKLLDESSVFASTLADAMEREPEPEPPRVRAVPFSFEPIEPAPVAPEPAPIELEFAPPPPPPPDPEPAPAVPEPVAEAAPEWAPEPEPDARISDPGPPAVERELVRIELPAEMTSAELVRTADAGIPPLLALTNAGIEARLAETIVAEADAQLRVFDPDEPFVNQVREQLASRIPTRRPTGKFRKRVIALVGPHESGKTAAAARLCEAHVALGRRVVAVSLEPVRETLELGKLTEGLDIELVSADHPGLIEFALAKLKRAEVVIVDTPGVASNDDGGWARLAMLLRPLQANETHLVLPGSLYPAGVDAFISTATEKLSVDRLLLTHLDRSPGAGPAISAAMRANIPISATSNGRRLVPADPYRLASLILP